MADYRAALGRGSDSMMGHLTPGEAIIPRGSMTPKLWAAYQEALDRQGMAPEQYVVGAGGNSINPRTGQPEFLAQASLPGKSVRDYKGGKIQGPESSSGRGGISGVLSKMFPTSPEMGGGIPRRQQQAMIETIPQDKWGSTDDGQFGEVKTGDYGPVVDLLTPGPIEAMLDLAGLDTTFEYVDPMNVPGMTSGSSFVNGPESPEVNRSINLLQGMTKERAMVEESLARPEVLPTPQFLGLSSAMSPLQMRTAIASRAIAGQGGEYTSPDAQAFYDNLLQRSLIGEEGDLFGLDTLLPIDLQYLAQIRGIENPADTQALLSALTQ